MDSKEHTAKTTSELGTPAKATPVAPLHAKASPTRAPQGYELTKEYDPGAYGNLLFGGSGSDTAPAWSDTAKGRLLIRTISRGVFGALAFTWGGEIANKHLPTYKLSAQIEEGKWLQYPARLIDVTFGKIIQKAVYTLHSGSEAERAKAAVESVNFRTKLAEVAASAQDKNVYQMTDALGHTHTLYGRSLGSEATNITFDFFMASIGDATARNMVQAIDPNIKHSWMLDKDGNPTTRAKGHFDAGKALKELGSTSWRIVTKNAGEDWAAALPYVYQMRWQRQALSKAWPGFKLSSDRGLNGGAALVNTAGEITGGFQKAGALDLHCRFVGYNFYTLMFREGYDTIANKFKEWKDDHFAIHAPHIGNPITAAVEGAAWSARYVAKSFIKANLYMQPAVLPFWIIRTPQTKWRGIYTNQELIESGLKENAILRAPNNDPFPRALGIHGKEALGEMNQVHWGNGASLTRNATPEGNANHIFGIEHPYELGTKRNIFDSALNLFGAACYHTGTAATKLVDRLVPIEKDCFATHLFDTQPAKKQLWNREKFIRKTVDASIAYTPYMWLKAETAQRVDDRKSVKELGYMDAAIYDWLDNVGTLNWSGIKNSSKEIWQLATHYEKPIKMREGGEAQPENPGVTAVEPPPASTPLPASPTATIQGGTIAHYHAARPPIQFNPDPSADQPTTHEKRWAESVAGRSLDGAFQSPSPLLH